MNYQHQQIAEVADQLFARLPDLERKSDILKAKELKDLFKLLPNLPVEQRSSFGKEINQLKDELMAWAEEIEDSREEREIDVTAPFDANTSGKTPGLLLAKYGSTHPLTAEISKILDIFYRMGFEAVESRQLDDDFHMFESLNFPEGHPARDDFDTFMTEEKLIAPAHTSTMQNRVISERREDLINGNPIACVIPGRVFRNEDLDARHEHTFYQLEGVYVSKDVNVGNLIAVLQTFFEEYYGKKMEVKTQPYYFPFTEPSFEFAIACPFCDKAGCHICGEGWIEMLGCGLIHPNVLKMAGVDPNEYSGFAWGGGIERLVMIKYGIEDIRYFESGRLEFLRQFA